MSYTVITVAIDDMTAEPLGVKEAAVMALEHLGAVRVLRVEAHGPEQLVIGGAAPPRPAAPGPASERARTPDDGQAPARPKWRLPAAMACCLNCARYRKEYGQDPEGAPYYGICGRTGGLVYKLGGQCAAWRGV